MNWVVIAPRASIALPIERAALGVSAEAVGDVAEDLGDRGPRDLLEVGQLAGVDALLPRADELFDRRDLRPVGAVLDQLRRPR